MKLDALFKNNKKPLTHAQQVERVKRNRKIFRVSLFVIVSLCIFAVLCTTVFFKINKINVSVSGKIQYTENQIISACGVEEGTVNFFHVDEQAIKEQLCEKLPYIKDVSVKKTFPSTITLVITADSAAVCVKSNGLYYLIDDEGKVLAKSEKSNGILLTLSSDTVCVVGQRIHDVNSESFDTADFFADLLKKVKNAKISKLTAMNISDFESITMRYDGRIDLLFGNSDYIEDKLRLAASSLNELDKESVALKGKLDLTKHKDANFTEYKR